MNNALSNTVIWLLVARYFLWVLADSFFHPASTGVSAAVNVFFVIAIATFHGLRRYSLKEFLIFFVIAFTVSNFYENLSILTGFPFGHYHQVAASKIRGGNEQRHEKKLGAERLRVVPDSRY
jgi:putative membrane protein